MNLPPIPMPTRLLIPYVYRPYTTALDSERLALSRAIAEYAKQVLARRR